MSTHFERSQSLTCSIETVARSVRELGAHHVAVVRRMPGLSKVELAAETDDSVTITTNEGVMTRSGVVRHFEDDRVVLEFDEEYRAGSLVTSRGHFRDEFETTPTGVVHRSTISDVVATGFLGFLYRTFGIARTGTALMKAVKGVLEEGPEGAA